MTDKHEKREDDGKYAPSNPKLGPKIPKVIGFKPYPKYYELCEKIGVQLNGPFVDELLRQYLTRETGYDFDN